jgi:quinol monooxygenase YgiN
MTGVIASIFVLIVELTVVPDQRDEFLEFVHDNLALSREYEGNIQFDVLVSDDRPDTVTFVERWESKEAFETYWAWREETGAVEGLVSYLTEPPKRAEYQQLFD